MDFHFLVMENRCVEFELKKRGHPGICVQVKLWDPLKTHAIPEHFCGGGDSLRRGAVSSVCSFIFVLCELQVAQHRQTVLALCHPPPVHHASLHSDQRSPRTPSSGSCLTASRELRSSTSWRHPTVTPTRRWRRSSLSLSTYRSLELPAAMAVPTGWCPTSRYFRSRVATRPWKFLKVLKKSFHFSRPWKVLENGIGPSKFWNLM